MKAWMGLVGVLFLVPAFSACSDDGAGPGSDDALKIGLLLPFSGALEAYGRSEREAADLAVAEINRAGGVLGRRIELLYEDTETNPAVVGGRTQKLIDAGVVAILGADASSSTLEAAKITVPAGVVQVSVASTSPALSELADNGLVYRTCPSDAYQGRVGAAHALEQFGLAGKSAAVLHLENAYGQGLAAAFKAEWEAGGGGAVALVPYPEKGETDIERYSYDSETAAALAGDPDLLFLIGYVLDSAKITARIKQSPRPGVLFGCDGQRSDDFLDYADPIVIEEMVGTAPAVPTGDANYDEFVKRYGAAYSRSPSTYAAGAYDVIYLISYAASKAGAATSAAIAGALRDVSGPPGDPIKVGEYERALDLLKRGKEIDYQGASGAIDWDAQGDVTSGVYNVWKVVKDGADLRFQDVETIPFP